MSRIFTFHQHLFGYDEGHRVMKSSDPLAPATLKELLPMTDSPGGSASSSRSFLIRGHPLKSHPAYALMCTWPAIHIGARPGTVWTHVILIPFADLAGVGIIEKLPSFFRYPNQITELNQYGKPVTIRSAALPEVPIDSWSQDQASQLIAGVYGLPGPYVHPFNDSHFGIHAGTNPKGVEGVLLSLVMAIWEQQWPRLRRSFTFMIGDWAVSKPYSRRSVWPDLVVLPSAPLRTSDTTNAEWVKLLVNDLMEGASGTLLREFLKRAGADTLDARTAMKPLVRLFIGLRLLDRHWDSREYYEVLRILTRDLVGSKTSTWVSQQVLDLNIWSQRPHFSLETFLEAVLAQEKLPETEEFWMTIVEPALKLDPALTVRVAADLPTTDRRQTDTFVKLVIDHAPYSTLLPFMQSGKWRDMTLSQRPELAILADYWDLPGNVKERVTWTIDKLLAVKKRSFNWSAVMQHVVQASPEGLPRRLVQRLDFNAFTGLLQVLSQLNLHTLPKGWLNTLNIRPKETALWLETQSVNTLTPALLDWVLVVTDEHLLTLETTAVIWQRVAQRLAFYPAEYRGAYATEFTCSCLIMRTEDVQQVLEAYNECWEHLERKRQSHRQHRVLDEHLPLPLHDWDDWDLCLRLELYVVDLVREPRTREAALQGLTLSHATARLADLLRSG